MKINLNHTIKVKLTDLGNKIYEDYLQNEYELLSHYPGLRWIDLKHREDQDGYIHFQLWEFMSIFGEHFYNGSEAVTENNEIIVSDDTITIKLQEQLRKARKKAKRWKRKYLELRYKLDKVKSAEGYANLYTIATDVPNFESEEYVEKKLDNYTKMLKSGILDFVKDDIGIHESVNESEDKE